MFRFLCFISIPFLFSCSSETKSEQTSVRLDSVGASIRKDSVKLVEEEIIIDTVFYDLDKQTRIRFIYNNKAQMASIDLYARKNNKWIERYHFDSLWMQVSVIPPVWKDYNGDGKKDLLFFYGTGARGNNAYYRLFVQDAEDQFHYVQGSSNIPNLDYDAERKTIVGVGYSATTSFDDYKYLNDSLVLDKSIEVYVNGEWTIREHSKIESNKRILIKRDSVHDKREGEFSRE